MYKMNVDWVGGSGNSLVLGLEPHRKPTSGLGVVAAGKEFVADAETKAPRMRQTNPFTRPHVVAPRLEQRAYVAPAFILLV